MSGRVTPGIAFAVLLFLLVSVGWVYLAQTQLRDTGSWARPEAVRPVLVWNSKRRLGTRKTERGVRGLGPKSRPQLSHEFFDELAARVGSQANGVTGEGAGLEGGVEGID